MDALDFPEGWNVENLIRDRKKLTIRSIQREIETAIVCGNPQFVVENRERNSDVDDIVKSLVSRGFQIEKKGRGKLHGGYAWRITWKTASDLRQEAEDAKRAFEERRGEAREKFIGYGYVGYEPSGQESTAGDLAGNYPV